MLLVLLAALVCVSSASRQPAAVAADIGRLLEEDVASGFQDISQLQALLWSRHGSNRQVMPLPINQAGCKRHLRCCGIRYQAVSQATPAVGGLRYHDLCGCSPQSEERALQHHVQQRYLPVQLQWTQSVCSCSLVMHKIEEAAAATCAADGLATVQHGFALCPAVAQPQQCRSMSRTGGSASRAERWSHIVCGSAVCCRPPWPASPYAREYSCYLRLMNACHSGARWRVVGDKHASIWTTRALSG
jgi:hypothetical protein